MSNYEDEADDTLKPWDVGAGGRGLLLLAEGIPELRLWVLDEHGRPSHADAIESLGLELDGVLASLIIEPDGQTTVFGRAGLFQGRTCEGWVWALDERLSERAEWNLLWDDD